MNAAIITSIICSVSNFAIAFIIKGFIDKKKLNKENVIKSLQNEKEDLNKKLIDKEKNIEFIAQIVDASPEENENVLEYKRLLSEDYIKYADSNDSLAEEATQLLKLQDVKRKIEFLACDTSLLNKNVIAIAGSFSSGKSSFMNSFFASRDTILPIGMDQTTAIPSYVLPSNETAITAYTYKGGNVDVPKEIFKSISHSKMNEFNFSLKQTINHFVFKNEFSVDLHNLCFIDTPGFNPGKEAEHDHEIAIDSILNADALIWCFDISAGTLKDDEIDILCEIYYNKPDLKIYIVANKGDLKSAAENEEVINSVEESLSINGIQFEGISVYSSRQSFINQKKDIASLTRGKSLNDFFRAVFF